MSGWGDVAAGRNHEDIRKYQPNSAWSTPLPDDNPWTSPKSARAFHDQTVDDPVKRGFTVRKKHGWWGAEEWFDAQGRKIK